MNLHGIKLAHAYLLLAGLAATPALAQASASVAAGNLNGTAQAGPAPLQRHAEGPRTDDTRNCNSRSVTVHSGNGSSSASASVSTPPGGASAAGENTKSRAAVHGNNNLNGNAMAMAHEGGTMAKSHTVCHDRSDSVDCRTKTMAHEPGGPPVKSTSQGAFCFVISG